MQHSRPAHKPDQCRDDRNGRQRVTTPGPAAGHRLLATTAALALSALVLACTPQVSRHGHLLSQSEIQQIQPGMSQEEVRLALGTPDTTSTVSGDTYYYISSTKKSVSFLKPETVDRRVVAVYFDPLGSVERIGHYGLQDGRVIDFVTRETPAHTRDRGFLQQVFRGVGRKKVYEDE